MNIIICVDKNNGMMFNNRRQSRDKKVIERIYRLIGNDKLWANSYSSVLFSDNVITDDKFLEKADERDWCFIENVPVPKNFRKLVIYNWNRVYPSDKKLTVDISGVKLISQTDFVGNSHDCITEYIYEK